jgi:hypothetical protein
MNRGIIYLVQPAELIGTNRYKIGCSENTELDRVKKGYKKGTRYILIMECDNPFVLEKQIKKIFNENFKLIAGYEYFEGEEEIMKEKFFKLKIEHDKNVALFNKNNTNNTNNTNNGQINCNNTVNIYQFGKEDYSKIPNQLILKAIMSSTGAGIPCKLIEKLHFNNDFPELKNICITDRNRKYALLWNGKQWTQHKYDDLGTDMLDRCLCLISDRMYALQSIVKDKRMFNIKKKALDELENIKLEDEVDDSNEDDKITLQKVSYVEQFRKQASEKIEESLYNNRKLVDIKLS